MTVSPRGAAPPADHREHRRDHRRERSGLVIGDVVDTAARGRRGHHHRG
ncbi:hypothetical protein [Streptomyces sp. NPDC090021]